MSKWQNCECVQVNPKDLDKDSFWVKVHEDALASEDLFSELKQNFSSKAVSKYTSAAAVLQC